MKAILRHTLLSLSAIALIFSLLLIPVSTIFAQSLFEHWEGTPSANQSREIWTDHSQGQTFTAESNHSVNGIDLMMYRRGNPGPVTISIFDADANHLPVGAPLASGIIDGNSLPAELANAMWKFIPFTSPCNVVTGNAYAITVEASTTDADVAGLCVDTESTYGGGGIIFKSGGTWGVSTWAHTVPFRVYDLPTDSSLTLSPLSASNRIFTEHSVTATYLVSGVPQESINVEIEVMSGPNKGDSGADTTDISGEATFDYMGDGGPGKDFIRATAFDQIGAPLALMEATKDWTGTLTLSLEPSSDSNPINTHHTVTATCLVNGAPQQGISVEFRVEIGPNAGNTGTVTTDSHGKATFTYRGDEGIGQDYIQAIVFNQAGEALAWDEATKDWTAGPLKGVGGDVYPVNKLSVMTPWIMLILTLIAGVIYLTRYKTSSKK